MTTLALTIPPHPLIATLQTAGELSRTVARNRVVQQYGAFDLRRNLSILAEALVMDATGVSLSMDRNILADRERSAAAVAAARARMAQRTAISQALEQFPRAYRVRLLDALAAGDGAREAEALLTAVDVEVDALLARLWRDSAHAVAG